MSNFICQTCGTNNIDCGKAGYKTDREIELEKKLEVAVEALEFYAEGNHYDDDRAYDYYRVLEHGEKAQEALAKIKEN